MEENEILDLEFRDENKEVQNQDTQIWSNSKRAKKLITVFWILIVFNVLAIASSYLELELLNAAQQSGYTDEDEATTNDMRQLVVGTIQSGLFIWSAVVFLNWFRRAYGNLHRLGRQYLRHNENMAVWSWIIPIISLFRPVQIMNEIWNGTQIEIRKFEPSYQTQSGSLIIGLWWTLFILSNFIGRYILRSLFKEQTIEELISSAQAAIAIDTLQIPEGLLVILIVSRLSKMESLLASIWEKNGGHIIYK